MARHGARHGRCVSTARRTNGVGQHGTGLSAALLVLRLRRDEVGLAMRHGINCARNSNVPSFYMLCHGMLQNGTECGPQEGTQDGILRKG